MFAIRLRLRPSAWWLAWFFILAERDITSMSKRFVENIHQQYIRNNKQRFQPDRCVLTLMLSAHVVGEWMSEISISYLCTRFLLLLIVSPLHAPHSSESRKVYILTICRPFCATLCGGHLGRLRARGEWGDETSFLFNHSETYIVEWQCVGCRMWIEDVKASPRRPGLEVRRRRTQEKRYLKRAHSHKLSHV
jgi:hypothetical protein